MIQNYDEFKVKKFEKLKSRTRKGIPDSLRSYIWKLFAEKNRFYQKDLFKKLESRSIKEDMELIIIKDLDRTYPNCQLIKDRYSNGQRNLYKVLSNYTKLNTSTGYEQGMGFIVAFFEGFYLLGFPGLKRFFFILLNLEKKLCRKFMHFLKKKAWCLRCIQMNGSFAYSREI